jgi:hypothetical protein
MMHIRKSAMVRRLCAWLACVSRVCVVLLAGVSLVGCSLSGSESRSWTEDVALPDGNTVRISRHVEYTESRDMSGGAYSALETKSTLQVPDAGAPVLQWNSPRMPVLLYRNGAGRWVVVATTSSCNEWSFNGKPSPPYWQYELLGAAWRQVALSRESVGTDANLFFRYTDARYEDIEYLTAAQKADIESSAPPIRYLESIGSTENFNCR